MEIKSAKGKEYPPLIKDLVKELLKDDPSVDMFNSGARSSWGKITQHIQ